MFTLLHKFSTHEPLFLICTGSALCSKHSPLASVWCIRRRSIFAGSFSHMCILMKGSRPLRLSMGHGFGFESSSETEPCERPRIASPNSFWPRLWNCKTSLTCGNARVARDKFDMFSLCDIYFVFSRSGE